VPSPKAVLLDVGGVLLLPNHERMLGALTRAGFTPSVEVLDNAHYAGAARLDDATVTTHWPDYWKCYLDAYITTCGVPDELREDAHQHLDSEFAVVASWTRIAPGSPEGLLALVATGVRLGIVSNADGTVEQQLREYGVVQVGQGAGVEVECVIDSGAVGVSKPDPRIFHFALDAMGVEPSDAWYVGDMPAFDVVGARSAGLRPFVMDPYQLHLDAEYERVASLTELAEIVTR
jgi:putative hydrolase of the HAD superfamily